MGLRRLWGETVVRRWPRKRKQRKKVKKKNTTPFTSIVLYDDGTLTKRFPRHFAILEMQNNRIFLHETVFLLNTGAGD